MFTNAKTVFINNKEVQSITLNNGETLYEKPSSNAHINQIRLKVIIDENVHWNDGDGWEFYFSGAFDYEGEVFIDWGDGETSLYNEDSHSHYYESTGEYEIIITGDITSIGNACFQGNFDIEEVDMSDCWSIENINNPFYDNSLLKHIIFPPSVVSYGEEYEWCTFENCASLEFILFTSPTPVSINEFTFTDLTTSCVIYVPQGTLSAYTSAQYYPNPNTYTYTEYSSLSNITGGNE